MKGILWAVSAACLLSSFSHIAIAQNPTKPKDNITINLDYSLDLLEFKIEPKDSYRYIKAPLTNKPTEATQALFKKYPSHHMVWQVFSEICNLGIREPKIVMSQALLETGQFKAKFLMERNNLFGFRAQRYLSFSNWKESVRYYRDWQVRRYKPHDKNYYAFLNRIRYGAPTYSQHLQQTSLWKHDCSVLNQVSTVNQLALFQVPLKKEAVNQFGG
jgi:hypothetical protein